MRKIFVCLANSKKFGERCIAGVEVERDEEGMYRIPKNENGNPIWVRPVTHAVHGQVSSRLVGHIKLLDVVEIEVIKACPRGYQSENIFFDKNHIQVVEQFDCNPRVFKIFASKDLTDLFGNRGKAVHIDDISSVTHSLVFVPAPDLRVQERENQLRGVFSFKGRTYDLPITDIKFIEAYRQDPQVLEGCTNKYLTISLGVQYKDFHFKLIAGILSC